MAKKPGPQGVSRTTRTTPGDARARRNDQLEGEFEQYMGEPFTTDRSGRYTVQTERPLRVDRGQLGLRLTDDFRVTSAGELALADGAVPKIADIPSAVSDLADTPGVTVEGARDDGTALASLIEQLIALGLPITDETTATAP